MKKNMILTVAAVLGSIGAAGADAAEWGNLKVKFVYNGQAPKAAPITVTKDEAVCGKHELVDESLLVGENGAIRNVIAYLYLSRGASKPDVHPSYEEAVKKEVRLDNLNCRFEPHVVTIQTGQQLVLGNKDPIGHNTKVDTLANSPINPIIPAGKDYRPDPFQSAERLPSRVSCSIHPWMQAIVVVTENPYAAVSDKEGVLELKNLPAGDWTIQFWHEKAGYVRDVTIDGKTTEWKRGRVDLTIKPGMNDLGEVKVNPANFE